MKDTVIKFPRSKGYTATPTQQLERIAWLYIQRMTMFQLSELPDDHYLKQDTYIGILLRHLAEIERNTDRKNMLLNELHYLITDFMTSAFQYYGEQMWERMEKNTSIEGLQQHIRITEQEHYEHSKSSNE